MEETQSVAAKTESVDGRFEDISRWIERNEGITTVSPEDVIDTWDKFKLWAGNIGARQTPDSAASLESRLKGARRVLGQVIDLLDTIQEALDDLFEIASGNQENRLIESNPGLVDQDSTWVQSPDRTDGKYEDQDLLELLSKSVGNLLRITVLIRKATPRDRFARALQGNNPFMDDFDIAYVAERYPKLAKPDARWLCERLGRAITKRRQFLRYSRDHNRRIAGHGDTAPAAQQRSSNPAEHDVVFPTTMAHSATPSIASGMRTNYSGSYAAHTHASTKASTLDIAELRRVEENEAQDDDTKSYISAGSSFQGIADATLHLPTLEEASHGSEVFECPICFDIQTITRESSWRRHAFQDLKAYVCTGEGTCDTKFFGDSRTWLDHELQCHRQQWACTLCPKGPFRSKKMFEGHLTQTHGSIIGEDLLPAFVSMGLRAVDAIPAGDCPFCDEWVESLQKTTPLPNSTPHEDVVITVDPKQYRRHVSHHLEQLALFALPRLADEHQNENASEEANVSRSTVNQLDSSPTDSEQEPGEEWIPDPPLHIAAARGDFEEVKRLVNDGADVHLRGETWGSVLDAALSHPGANGSGILPFLRLELELENYEHQVAGGLPSATTSTPDVGGQLDDASKSSPDTMMHKCPYCERDFSRIQHLRSHRSTHAQELSLVCPDCQMGFRRLKDLKRHRKVLHESDHTQNEPWGSSYIKGATGEKGTGSGNPLLEGDAPETAFRAYESVLPDGSVAVVHKRPPGPPGSREIPLNEQYDFQVGAGFSQWMSDSGRGLTNEAQPDYFEYINPAYLVRYDLEKDREKQFESTKVVKDTNLVGGQHYDAARYKLETPASTAHDAVDGLVGRTVGLNLDNKRNPPGHLRVTTESPETESDHLTPESRSLRKTEPRLKGILKKPTPKFPFPTAMAKDGGVPANSEKPDMPPGASWTKISRTVVDPMVLFSENERFEERDSFVVVRRLLSEEEVHAYIRATEGLKIARREEKKQRSQRMRQEEWRLKELHTLTTDLKQRRRGHEKSDSEDDENSGRGDVESNRRLGLSTQGGPSSTADQKNARVVSPRLPPQPPTKARPSASQDLVRQRINPLFADDDESSEAPAGQAEQEEHDRPEEGLDPQSAQTQETKLAGEPARETQKSGDDTGTKCTLNG
ncbi:hypothetical protein PG995_012070 [Apiospora arundinis]